MDSPAIIGNDNHAHPLKYRDSCRCSQCVNQDTMQRNFNIFDLPDLKAITPLDTRILADGLKIICESLSPFLEVCTYSTDSLWLRGS